MTASTSRLAYDDAYALLDAAIADDKGIKLKMIDWAAANHMRSRCHMARKIDRAENALTYERPHPLHGVSEYDRIKITIEAEGQATYLVFSRINTIPGEVMSLSTGEQVEVDLPQLPSVPTPKALPAPKAPTDTELGDAFEEIEPVEAEPARSLRRV